jgi:hypothetical protein
LAVTLLSATWKSRIRGLIIFQWLGPLAIIANGALQIYYWRSYYTSLRQVLFFFLSFLGGLYH